MAALRALGGRERVRTAERLSPEELTSGLPGERLTHLYLLAYDAGESLSWLAAFPRLEVLRLGRHVPAVHGVPDGIRLERDGGRAS